MYKDVLIQRPSLHPATVRMRPEKILKKIDYLDAIAHAIKGFTFKYVTATLNRYKKFIPLIHGYAKKFSLMPDVELKRKVLALRKQFMAEGNSDDYIAQCFALAREVSGRTLGMYHFDSQLLGGLVLYHGNIAEMQTGEGKSLTAVLPAVTAAIAGIPVHIITVNDYLAKRDAETMKPIYALLGIEVGVILHEMKIEERQKIYQQDVVYCTNKELVFDYLKDQLILKANKSHLHLHADYIKGIKTKYDKLMLRGLHFAIIDEADSVLMDEARTPLVISAQIQENTEQNIVLSQAISLATHLQEKIHYNIDHNSRLVKLNEQGEKIIAKRSSGFGFHWSGRIRRIELVEQALVALHLFVRDHHYLVRDKKIHIIDEHTGRVMEGRSWEKGLHQLIEIKEDCDISAPRSTLTRISYQIFFRKYHHVGGMTGTAREVINELWRIYGLHVVPVPTHHPSKRIYLPAHVFFSKEEKWTFIVDRIIKLHDEGRPVLVGTKTLATSVALSDRLSMQGLQHRVLNASHDHDEADIISQAGGVGKITIATSMAGRGTDIKLAAGVNDSGGLHVILTELHDASRIDRQLLGRCARFGDRGSVEYAIALEDSLVQESSMDVLKFICNIFPSESIRNRFGLFISNIAQSMLEKRYEKNRYNLLKLDEQHERMLAFAKH